MVGEEEKIFKMVNDKLYIWSGVDWKYIPTIGERTLLIKHLHLLGAHAGVARTLSLIKE